MKKLTKTLILLVLMVIFFSCDKPLKSITLDCNRLELHYKDSIRLNATHNPPESMAPVYSWHSSNEKAAVIDQFGMVNALRVGSAIITVSTNDSLFSDVCIVDVLPRSYLFIEPVHDFVITRAELYELENRAFLYETKSGVVYAGENNDVHRVMYMFDESGTLSGSAVLFNANKGIVDRLMDYMMERHVVLFAQDVYIFFRVNDDVVAGTSFSSSLGLNVIYMQDDGEKSTKIINFAPFIKMMKKIQ